MKKIESAQLSRLLKFVLIGYSVRVEVNFCDDNRFVELTKKSTNELLKSCESVGYEQSDDSKMITISARYVA